MSDEFKIFLKNIGKNAGDKKLSKETGKVLFYLMSFIDFENPSIVGQAEISKNLDIPLSSVNNAFNQLIEANILTKMTVKGRMGNHDTYKFNDELWTEPI
ncbi:hypothetical protein SAMD00079811_83350 (plasmid) [Scytonema sp. HK-05]|uniref:hypothetical protein n=1 Tax=Scytonema sp. HK-05 TaxID=1137095 RepID=UPI0009369A49|nr:hypothetical protein [Scytonema sp. HK-05]OKH42758.1 hypothetical protein NIES2130_39525 [Scytonema sp. HK-05]BAY50704.1 hypothetical protein SAMD00079811_83350 [Scytonema sp. HK-05]